jgi:hypothetical protein
VSWSEVKTILALVGGAFLLYTFGGWAINLISDILSWLASTGVANQ